MKNEDTHRKVRLKKKISKPELGKLTEEDLQLTHLPDNFEIELLGKMVSDLNLGDLNDPDQERASINIDAVHRAVRSRDPERVIALAKMFSPQSIMESGITRPDLFYSLYQIGALLKKFPFPASTAKAKALADFYASERRNRLFNQQNFRAIVSLSRRHPDWYACIDEIRADIEKLIGAEPQPELVFRLAQHGPGTSVGFEGAEGRDTSFFKWMSLPYTVSPAAKNLAIEAIESNPLWVRALHDWYRTEHSLTVFQPIDIMDLWSKVFKITNYCRYTSVPKTFETERGIAIEPTLNVFLQLGVKAFFYARLRRRWGIDLSNQAKNQELACDASIKDDKVTVDLKGASNSVTYMACALLLPVAWYDFLDDLRSRFILIPREHRPDKKTKLRTEMFSAMGNGFTFAIETIIFAALVRYAMRKSGAQGDTAVYGDDIIVPKTAYPVLHEILLLFGFEINESKSFVSGPFRESCGADCLSGYSVTPIKVDKPVSTVRDLWKLHNIFWNHAASLPWFYDVRFTKTCSWLRSFIPSKFRGLKGPPSESVDSYLFTNQRPDRQPDRTFSWWGITTRPINYDNRTDLFYFRALLNAYRPRPEWKVLDPINAGGSVYSITIRGHVRSVCTSFTGYY